MKNRECGAVLRKVQRYAAKAILAVYSFLAPISRKIISKIKALTKTKLFKSGTPVVVISVVAVVAIGVFISTFAFSWFFMNESLKQKNMGVSAEATPNLVISDTQAGLAAAKISSGNPFEVSTEVEGIENMIPATRYDGRLCFIVGTTVDPDTGLSGGETLYDVPVSENSPYYHDSTVFIGALDAPFEGVSLVAALDTSDVDRTVPSHNAATVEFYLDGVSPENYVGSLNVAGLDSVTYEEKTSLTIPLENDTVPVNKTGYVKIVMRLYYDGALTNAERSVAFINTSTVSGDKTNFSVIFTATEN